MLVSAYHEVTNNKLDSILKVGLKQGAYGDKSTDKAIMKTDKFLDNCRPESLKSAGLSRQSNLYCYFSNKDGVVDITDGQIKNPAEVSQSPKHALLKVQIDPGKCYVSNLDLYDRIMEAIKRNDNQLALQLGRDYWQQIIPLGEYNYSKGFKRPEVIVTYNVAGSYIEVVKS
jgi:hypothetical protein